MNIVIPYQKRDILNKNAKFITFFYVITYLMLLYRKCPAYKRT
nr:MAG TPA: glutathione synthetase-like effector 22 [Caudoviricetes sp.]